MRGCALLVSILVTQLAFGQHQVPKAYYDLAKKADSLYQVKAYKAAADTYTQAFKANRWMGFMPEMYGAARAWARVGNADSAFRKIDRLMTYGTYQDQSKIPAEPAFVSLHQDKRWNSLVVDQLAKINSKLNKPLMAELDSIYKEDQKYRMMVDSVGKKYGFESREMKNLWKQMAKSDSTNSLKVKSILDTHGWLSPEVVGKQGNNTLFLVIQHADSATQVKYLPMLREAVKKGKAEANQLAMLEDRVALRQGRKQIYGTQVGVDNKSGSYYVVPIEDPENVDKRRAAVGLSPIGDYVKQWGIIWDVEEHQKQQDKQ